MFPHHHRAYRDLSYEKPLSLSHLQRASRASARRQSRHFARHRLRMGCASAPLVAAMRRRVGAHSRGEAASARHKAAGATAGSARAGVCTRVRVCGRVRACRAQPTAGRSGARVLPGGQSVPATLNPVVSFGGNGTLCPRGHILSAVAIGSGTSGTDPNGLVLLRATPPLCLQTAVSCRSREGTHLAILFGHGCEHEGLFHPHGILPRH